MGLPKCDERVSIGRIGEYLESKRWEYVTASKRQKGRILDEVCEALRYHRKAAIRTLRQKPGQGRKRSGRPRRYGGEVISALRQVWEASDQLCGRSGHRRSARVAGQTVERVQRSAVQGIARHRAGRAASDNRPSPVCSRATWPRSGYVAFRVVELDITAARHPNIVAERLRAHRGRQLLDRLAVGEAWQDSGLVFTSNVGTPIYPENMGRMLRPRLERAGLPPATIP
jgi:hypothetical protein